MGSRNLEEKLENSITNLNSPTGGWAYLIPWKEAYWLFFEVSIQAPSKQTFAFDRRHTIGPFFVLLKTRLGTQNSKIMDLNIFSTILVKIIQSTDIKTMIWSGEVIEYFTSVWIKSSK